MRGVIRGVPCVRPWTNRKEIRFVWQLINFSPNSRYAPLKIDRNPSGSRGAYQQLSRGMDQRWTEGRRDSRNGY
jgi:hypothetical protein